MQTDEFHLGGQNWTEPAKETPEFHSSLAPTSATLSNFLTFSSEIHLVHVGIIVEQLT